MKVACTVLNGESGSNAADLHNSYLNSKSRQNAVYSTVAKSLPKKWVILPKPFV